MKLLNIELQHDDQFSEEQIAALDRLSNLVSASPGFIWKAFKKIPPCGRAAGIYLFEDDLSAQLYGCRFALHMSALGVARISTHIHAIEPGVYGAGPGGIDGLLFSPSPVQWPLDDLVA